MYTELWVLFSASCRHMIVPLPPASPSLSHASSTLIYVLISNVVLRREEEPLPCPRWMSVAGSTGDTPGGWKHHAQFQSLQIPHELHCLVPRSEMKLCITRTLEDHIARWMSSLSLNKHWKLLLSYVAYILKDCGSNCLYLYSIELTTKPSSRIYPRPAEVGAFCSFCSVPCQLCNHFVFDTIRNLNSNLQALVSRCLVLSDQVVLHLPFLLLRLRFVSLLDTKSVCFLKSEHENVKCESGNFDPMKRGIVLVIGYLDCDMLMSNSMAILDWKNVKLNWSHLMGLTKCLWTVPYLQDWPENKLVIDIKQKRSESRPDNVVRNLVELSSL